MEQALVFGANSRIDAISAINDDKFDLEDFKNRWQSARLNVLKKNAPLKLIVQQSIELMNEKSLLVIALQLNSPDRDQILKQIFDVSRKFAISASRYFGLTWELSDFSEVLPKLGIPCFSVPFEPYKRAYISKRKGCEDFAQLQSFGCDYWRESLDGLVMGLGETERLARHASVGYGGDECVDVLFTEEVVLPRIISDKPQYKFGPITDLIEKELIPVQAYFKKMNIQLNWEGISEGVLYFKMDSTSGPVCGAGGRFMHQDLEKKINKILPQLKVKDASPLAVYGEKA